MSFGRGWTCGIAIVFFALPSCTSSPPTAQRIESGSYVRQPTVTERSTTPRTLVPTPMPFTAANRPTIPADAEMRDIAAKVDVRQTFPWRYIVLHHSGSPTGNADTFAAAHKKRGWDGLGYHFVIGNGGGSRDGLIEVGYRWPGQLQGAHAGSFQYNRYGIGICLVGNFDQTRPTANQLASLERLVAFLMTRYNIPSANVIEHRGVKQTACPGRLFPLTAVLSGASQHQRHLATAGNLPTPAEAGMAAQAKSPAATPTGPPAAARASTVLRPVGYPYH